MICPEYDEHGHKRISTNVVRLPVDALDLPATEIITVLRKLIEDHGEDVHLELSIDYNEDYDDRRTTYNVYARRYETDKERDTRVAREENYRLADAERQRVYDERKKSDAVHQERMERDMLRTLLEKYGTGNI